MPIFTGENCYRIWAPDQALWAPWSKPVLFADMPFDTETPLAIPDLAAPGIPDAFADAGVVIDLPGPEAVAAGLALAKRGFRPVPLFNGTSGPSPMIDVDPIRHALGAGISVLQQVSLPPDAKPAFLLDSRRLESQKTASTEGYYDNRWVTLPQDFPSGTFLLSHGIRSMAIIQREGFSPREDLAHVLVRWQEAGVRLRAIDIAANRLEDPLVVKTPSRFRRAWYVAIVLLGLRRNNIGGFGSYVPLQTGGSGGSGFYG